MLKQKRYLVAILGLAVFGLGYAAGQFSAFESVAQAQGERIFEMRTYTALPGRLDALKRPVPRPHDADLREARHDQHRLLDAAGSARWPRTRWSTSWRTTAARRARRAGTRSARIPSGRRCPRNRSATAGSWKASTCCGWRRPTTRRSSSGLEGWCRGVASRHRPGTFANEVHSPMSADSRHLTGFTPPLRPRPYPTRKTLGIFTRPSSMR